MPGWFKSLLGWSLSGLTDLWNKVISVIQTVFNYIGSIDNAIWAEFTSLYHSFTNLLNAVELWTSSLYNYVLAWATTHLAAVISWAENEFTSLEHAASAVVSWVSGLLAALRAWVESLVSGLEQWVIQNIWDPLSRDVNDALGWIVKEGYFAYNLLTHPELLVQLLAKYLWSSWLAMLHKYAGPIGAFLLHQMIRMASPVESVLEEIISSLID